jgi:hypothetical protein
MTENYRHYRAHPGGPSNTVVVFVPIEGGSPKTLRTVKPGSYPVNQPGHWRPAQHPPKSKGAATVDLLRRTAQQNEEVREFMRRAREGDRRHA